MTSFLFLWSFPPFHFSLLSFDFLSLSKYYHLQNFDLKASLIATSNPSSSLFLEPLCQPLFDSYLDLQSINPTTFSPTNWNSHGFTFQLRYCNPILWLPLAYITWTDAFLPPSFLPVKTSVVVKPIFHLFLSWLWAAKAVWKSMQPYWLVSLNIFTKTSSGPLVLAVCLLV